jgi:hypothetical protein
LSSLDHVVSNYGDLRQLDVALSSQFSFDDNAKVAINLATRGGALKSSFNYLLIDPRISRNLPLTAVGMEDQDAWRTFLESIFYVGKGTRSRPFSHLYEAVKRFRKQGGSRSRGSGKQSRKIDTILAVWEGGGGVVCLQESNFQLCLDESGKINLYRLLSGVQQLPRSGGLHQGSRHDRRHR